MNLNRWLTVILTMGLILAFNPLAAQAEPPWERPYYHHPRGKAHGWYGKRHHDYDRHYRHFRRSCEGPHHYRRHEYHAGPPVAYVAPAPVIAIPYAQPQPYYSQPATPGFSGSLNYNF